MINTNLENENRCNLKKTKLPSPKTYIQNNLYKEII